MAKQRQSDVRQKKKAGEKRKGQFSQVAGKGLRQQQNGNVRPGNFAASYRFGDSSAADHAYKYDQMDMANRFASPSLKHLCGTDEMGRDIFSRLLYGGRASLSFGIHRNNYFHFFGNAHWLCRWIFRGNVDTIVMRLIDILQAIPGILLAIAISACLGSGLFNTVLALSIGGIPMTVRLLRGSIMGVRKMEYIEAAQK